MRKVLLMVFAIGMFMALGSAGATASSSSGSSSKGSDKRCNNPGGGNSKHGCKPCPKGHERGKNGKCVKPAPKPCPKGQERGKDGKCANPAPKPCKAGEERGKDGNCKPKPPVPCKDNEIKTDKGCVPRPKDGPCSLADLVLLEDLLKGTGGLLCVYLGDNAPNADKDKNCPEATLALPIDNLVGACLYLPPVEIEDDGGSPGTTPTTPTVPSLTDLPSTLTAVLDVVLKLKLK